MKNDRLLFVAGIIAIATTSFGFVSRAFLIEDWGRLFDLSRTQIGALQGVGLYPFALSIILLSFVIDRVGYGRILCLACVGHVSSAIITMTARGYTQLYIGTMIFALANGAVEAAVNPMVATLYPRSKTHHLNMLHAGWPGGLVFGGLLAISMGSLGWRWRIGLFLVPAALYGVLFVGRRFPVQERVAAGVSYRGMLQEFGWAGCLIVSAFVAGAVNEMMRVFGSELSTAGFVAVTVGPALVLAGFTRSFGRPMFVLLLVMMVLLSTTELGTDSWVAALMTPVLRSAGTHAGNWVLIYTAAIMFVMRFFAGPIVERLSPLGLLASGAALAAAGLFALASAGAATAVFLSATLYGIGKAFFWPTTLGVVSEQFPKGGALTINAMSGMGMIAVGVLGSPLLGTLQDHYLDRALREERPALYSAVAETPMTKYGFTFRALDKAKIAALTPEERTAIDRTLSENSQATLAKVAVLPTIMLACYIGLLFYFRRAGGYQPVVLKPCDPKCQS